MILAHTFNDVLPILTYNEWYYRGPLERYESMVINVSAHYGASDMIFYNEKNSKVIRQIPYDIFISNFTKII